MDVNDARLSSQVVLAAATRRSAADWQEAIRLACALLEQRAAVRPEYADRCIATVEEHGPYIVLTPGIALAHARPEEGVERLGVSVVTLSEPVEFGHPDNDPVDVVFAFGSPDDEQHLAVLAELARELSEGLGDRLRRADDDAAAQTMLERIAADD
ncbi:MAG TPA: PTS sugar transporter subunit IIA [Jiangellaceae bacterium]|nr:PTS sugar transporter subunit IIA [Jiangellaceae bacterium]